MDHHVQPGDRIIFPRVYPPPSMITPGDIATFLLDRGWVEVSNTPDDQWSHAPKGRAAMSWEQAVACEFYEFITLGGR